VLSPATGGFFFGEILAGVVREAGRLGARVALVQTVDAGLTGDVSPGMVSGVHPVAWHHLDGFVASAWASTDDYLRRLHAVGKPLAMACTTVAGVDACSVVIDNDAGIRLSIEHLITHGHSRIAFAGRIQQSDVIERYAAYTAHMPECGLEPMPRIEIDSDIELGGRVAAGLIAALPTTQRPTAVLAATDRVALGLITGLRGHGLRVPQDIAVIGFDDVPAGWYSTPQLTTVRQRFDEVGAAATTVLLAELTDHVHRSGRILVPTTLVRRQSCGCDASPAEPSDAIAYAARTLVGDLDRRITAGTAANTPAGTPADPTRDPARHAATVRDIDASVTAALGRLPRGAPSPEAGDGSA
jgi:DNA-binding LacI/PurR family transcriptional regulator